jgi:hypothetical protein
MIDETPIAQSLDRILALPNYMRVDDNLRLTSYNALASVVLQFRYRFLDIEGGNVVAGQETQTPNTDRTAKTSIFPTPEGWLLGGEVFASGAAPLLGQTYVVVEVVRGLASSATPLQVIAAGYLSAKQPLQFPALGPGASLDGAGALRSITGATPAAGAEIAESVPTGARWELLAFQTQFVTSAAVANRIPQLVIDDGANVVYRVGQAANQAASLTFRRSWFPGGPSAVADNANNVALGLPIGLRLGAGYRLRTITTAIDAGDQYSAIQYVVREWLEGA